MTAPKYDYSNTSWAPVMRLDEFVSVPGGLPGDPASDRFASQTYEIIARPDMEPRPGSGMKAYFRWGVFIPESINRKAPPRETKLHIFFAPWLARVSALRHALRYFSNFHDFVLLVVPCEDDKHPIPLKGRSRPEVDDDDISTILRSLGLSIDVSELHITAHSRGYNSLRESLKHGAFDLQLSKKVLYRVVMMDCLYPEVPTYLSGKRVPSNSIIGYHVHDWLGTKPWSYHRLVDLRPLAYALRAIGYARMLHDAHKIRSITLPSSWLEYPVKAVMDGPSRPLDPLPEFGYFTTPKGNTFSPGTDPVCGGKCVSLEEWCGKPPGPRTLRLKLLQDESPGKWSTRLVLGVCDVNQWLWRYWQVLKVGSHLDAVPPNVGPPYPYPDGPLCRTYEHVGPIRDSWDRAADVYAHEYVVSELWHETLAASVTVMSFPAPIIR